MKKTLSLVVICLVAATIVTAIDETDVDFSGVSENYNGPILEYAQDTNGESDKTADFDWLIGQLDCSDTDGGLGYFNKGTVSGRFYDIEFEFTDICLKDIPDAQKPESPKLIEWYCDSYHPSVKLKRCQNGCYDGECANDDIPEFSVIGTSIVLIGAGLVMLRRRK